MCIQNAAVLQNSDPEFFKFLKFPNIFFKEVLDNIKLQKHQNQTHNLLCVYTNMTQMQLLEKSAFSKDTLQRL